MMKNRRTILVCPKCETQLSIYDDRENKQLLYCDKCEKIYQYYGPKEVEVQRGTSKIDIKTPAGSRLAGGSSMLY